MPSFATEVKNEIARLMYTEACDRTAEMAALLRMGVPMTVAALRNPYDLSLMPENTALLSGTS